MEELTDLKSVELALKTGDTPKPCQIPAKFFGLSENQLALLMTGHGKYCFCDLQANTDTNQPTRIQKFKFNSTFTISDLSKFIQNFSEKNITGLFSYDLKQFPQKKIAAFMFYSKSKAEFYYKRYYLHPFSKEPIIQSVNYLQEISTFETCNYVLFHNKTNQSQQLVQGFFDNFGCNKLHEQSMRKFLVVYDDFQAIQVLKQQISDASEQLALLARQHDNAIDFIMNDGGYNYDTIGHSITNQFYSNINFFDENGYHHIYFEQSNSYKLGSDDYNLANQGNHSFSRLQNTQRLRLSVKSQSFVCQPGRLPLQQKTDNFENPITRNLPDQNFGFCDNVWSQIDKENFNLSTNFLLKTTKVPPISKKPRFFDNSNSLNNTQYQLFNNTNISHQNFPMQRNPDQNPETNFSSFDISIKRITDGFEKRRTVMVKNIPNKYDQETFMILLDDCIKGKYDFFYLPMDFTNGCNIGYGFLNLINGESLIKLIEQYDNRKWDVAKSQKICKISFAKHQGRNRLIKHFKRESFKRKNLEKGLSPIVFPTQTNDFGIFQSNF